MARVADQPKVRQRHPEREEFAPALPPAPRPAPPVLPWESVFWVATVAVAFLLRMHELGVRALHHDESLHAVYSWRLFQGQGYTHDPMMHGPFQFHANALMMFLFGDNEVSVRLTAVLCGTGLVILAYFLRAQLGRWGAMALAVLFTISPALLYFSRFTREDIYFGFFTLLMMVGLLNYVRTRQPRWLYVGSVGLALAFSTKEAIYLVGFLVVSFVAIKIVAEHFWHRYDARLHGNGATAAAAPWGSELLGAVLSVRPVVLLNCVAIVIAICVTLFTTFFTNPNGIQTGTIGALQYWMEQQGVARGSQPTYYYFLLMPLYEFTAVILAVAAALVSGANKRGLGLITAIYLVVGLVFFQLSRPERVAVLSAHEAQGWFLVGMAYAATLVLALSRRGSLFFWFTLYWAIGAISIYTLASEKMPWLLVHLAIPLNLLAAQFVGWAADRLEWRRVFSGPYLLAALLTLLMLGMVIPLTTVMRSPVADPLAQQRAQLWQMAVLVMLFAAAVGLWELGRRQGWRFLPAPMGTACVLGLVALTIHIGWQVTYKNGDTPNDMLVYVQSSPDIPRVMEQLEYLSHITGTGKEFPVMLDNGYTDTENGTQVVHESVAWPFEWYLRNWTKKTYFSRTLPPDTGGERPPAIIVMSTNIDPIRDRIADYVGQKYRLNWWYPEDYKGWTVQSVWDGLFGPDSATTRLKLWRYFLYREPLNPLGSRDFYLYVRPDLARGVVGGGPGALAPLTSPASVAPMPPSVSAPGVGAAEGAGAAPAEGAAAPGGAPAAVAPATAAGGLQVLGRIGTGPATLQEAKEMARDAAGRLYVVQSQAGRITILNPDGSVAGTLGKPGTGDGEFQEPWSVAIAPDGSVYVADTWNHRIQKFDASGRFITKWGNFVDTKGQRDAEPYGFWGPRDVAIGPDGNVYVSDTGNKRIQVFDPNGRYLRAIGGEGSGPGQFKEPVGIAFDPAGNLWVADTWNQRIQKLNPTTDQQLAQYPVPAWSSQAITDKPYLRVDPTGRVYATVPSERRVLMIAPDGTMANSVAALQNYPFQKPIGVLAGPDGALWVSDSAAGVVVAVPGASPPAVSNHGSAAGGGPAPESAAGDDAAAEAP